MDIILELEAIGLKKVCILATLLILMVVQQMVILGIWPPKELEIPLLWMEEILRAIILVKPVTNLDVIEPSP